MLDPRYLRYMSLAAHALSGEDRPKEPEAAPDEDRRSAAVAPGEDLPAT